MDNTQSSMRKKALTKTIIDLFLIITIGGISLSIIIFSIWLFFMIPYWVINSFDAFKQYADSPAFIIYGGELCILLIMFLICYGVRHLYLYNLAEIEWADRIKSEKENEAKIGKSHDIDREQIER